MHTYKTAGGVTHILGTTEKRRKNEKKTKMKKNEAENATNRIKRCMQMSSDKSDRLDIRLAHMRLLLRSLFSRRFMFACARARAVACLALGEVGAHRRD